MYLVFQFRTDWDSKNVVIIGEEVEHILGVRLNEVSLKTRFRELEEFGVRLHLRRENNGPYFLIKFSWPEEWDFVMKLTRPRGKVESRVLALDGSPFDPERPRPTIEVDEENVEPLTQNLLKVLHGQPIFVISPKLREQLHGVNEGLYRSHNENSMTFTRNQALITRFCDCGYETYNVAGNTTRIFPTSISAASRKIRKTAHKELGLVTVDVSASQLRIVRLLWDIPLLDDYLADGVSFWQKFLSECGLDPAFDKDAAKRLVYAAVFGQSLRVSKRTAVEELGKSRAGGFHSHPLVVELFRKRTEFMDGLIHDGHGTDAFGRKVVANKDNIRTATAMIVQSYEHKMTATAALRCHGLPGIRLRTFLHDGFSLETDGTMTLQQIIETAEEAAREAIKDKDFNLKFDYE